MKLLSFILLLSTPAFAGTWKCETGLDGKMIYSLVVQGDESGHLASQGTVAIAGLGGPMSVKPDQADTGELARYLVGAEDPRSKTRLRIMTTQSAPNVFEAHTLLVNFAIKQEFEGTCTYTP